MLDDAVNFSHALISPLCNPKQQLQQLPDVGAFGTVVLWTF